MPLPEPPKPNLPPKPPQTPPVAQLAEEIKLEPHEIEQRKKAALLAKVRMMRETLAANQGMVGNMKPGKVYVWVHHSDNRQIHFQSMGYELCKDPDIKSNWRRTDGTHVRGDVVLYQIDKDLHEAIDLDSQLRAIEAIEGAKEGFKVVADRLGFPVYEPGKQQARR